MGYNGPPDRKFHWSDIPLGILAVAMLAAVAIGGGLGVAILIGDLVKTVMD